MFAGMTAFIFPHHGEGFFSHVTHLHRAIRVLKIDHWAYMQTTDRGMGIPGTFRTVFMENLSQAVGIIGQIF